MSAGDTPESRVPSGPEQPGAAPPESEVLLSGLDTGPGLDERSNLTPTQEHARLAADTRVRSAALGLRPEPDSEDPDLDGASG